MKKRVLWKESLEAPLTTVSNGGPMELTAS